MGRKRKWGPQTFFLFYEFDGGGGVVANKKKYWGAGGHCSLVPFKNWLVFPCSRSVFALVPYFCNLLALPPPPPLLLDSRLYLAALKFLMLTDGYFLFRYLHLISNSKHFSYP